MNVRITYQLGAQGRKASILAGGDGKAEQTIEVPREAPEFARALARAEVAGDGTASLDLTGWRHPSHDAPRTAAEILDSLDAAEAETAAKDAEKKAARREATMAVLRERKTENAYAYAYRGGHYYTTKVPSWGYDPDPEVTDSPEAAAWRAELDALNEAAAAECLVRVAREAAAKEEAEAKKAEELAAFRARHGIEEGQESFRIEDGALVRVPCWCTHKRGKNWMAEIKVNPASPGGLDRAFFAKAKGDSFYLVGDGGSQLTPGMALEFGADYYTGSGSPRRERWFGFVVRVVSEDDGRHLAILEVRSTGKAAVKAGAALKQSVTA